MGWEEKHVSWRCWRSHFKSPYVILYQQSGEEPQQIHMYCCCSLHLCKYKVRTVLMKSIGFSMCPVNKLMLQGPDCGISNTS